MQIQPPFDCAQSHGREAFCVTIKASIFCNEQAENSNYASTNMQSPFHRKRVVLEYIQRLDPKVRKCRQGRTPLVALLNAATILALQLLEINQ